MDVKQTISIIHQQLHEMATLLHLSAEEQRVMERSIRTCIADLEKMSKKKSSDFEKNVSNVTKALTDTVSVLKMLKSGDIDPFAVLGGAMKLFSSIAAIVGGPLGVVFTAAGQILSAVFSLFTFGSQEECLASQVYKIVTKALQEFDMKQLSRRVEGWRAVAKEMIMELKHQQASSSDSGFQPERFDIFIELMGELSSKITPTISFETTYQCVSRSLRNSKYLLPHPGTKYASEDADKHLNVDKVLDHLIESCKLATHPLTNADEFQQYKDSIPCMSLYANIATYYYMVLTWHLTLSKHSKEVKVIENKLNSAKQTARDLLGFLSDSSLLSSFEGLINGKLLIMEAFLCDAGVVQYAESFRKGIGLSKTEYTLKDVQTAAVKLSMFSDLNLDVSPSCCQAADRGDNHFIGITNNTRWPINVFSGEAGDHINNLQFHVIIRDGASYTHGCTGEWTGWNFSVGGVFCVGNDTANRVDEIKEGTIISFALSNPFLGCRKINTVVTNSIVSKRLAWDNLEYGGDKAKYFTHKGQVCFVKGMIRDGKSGCRVWNFSIEEFDKEKLQSKFTTSVADFVALQKVLL